MMTRQEAIKPGTESLKDPLTDSIIAAAICVHRELGPGFLDTVYEEAIALEFGEREIQFVRQKPVSILYREHHVGEHRLDFLVESSVIIELKSVADFENIHYAVMRSYLRATDLQVGLLLNFATATLSVKRVSPQFTGVRTQSHV